MTDEERNESTEETETTEEKPEAKSSKTFTQEQLDQIVAERLERKDRKQAEEKAETERVAREKALKDQEDWKGVAKEHETTISERETRIAELESVEGERDTATERVSALEERLKGLIKPQLEVVPDIYRSLVVEKMTIEEQAEWLEENAEKLGTQNGPGRPAGSRPTGKVQSVPKREVDKDAREGQRASRVSAI